MAHHRNLPLHVASNTIAGHSQRIALRTYVPTVLPDPTAPRLALPVVLYFHGGCFVHGDLDCADTAARAIAEGAPAVVVSVGYSLSPQFPFPAPLEDGYLAALWVQANAKTLGVDARRMGVAGHDAGGNLAAGMAAMARDRQEVVLRAQALLAPLLDPSMTRLADARTVTAPDLPASECAHAYRAYLPEVRQQLHPYAAPLESRRLARLPPTLIVGAGHDLLHLEGETYAGELIAAGVPTETTRYADASHQSIASHPAALAAVADFFRRRLAAT